jgi:hypothetical protein
MTGIAARPGSSWDWRIRTPPEPQWPGRRLFTSVGLFATRRAHSGCTPGPGKLDSRFSRHGVRA